MHIAIDVRSLMGTRHSGVEEYTTQIIKAMSVAAPLHTYHLFYNSARAVRLPAFRENVVVHPFRYPNKGFNALQWLFRAPRWDKMLRQHIDVVFVPNPRLVPLSYTVPLVTVAHDVSFERFPEFLTLRRRLWHALMRPRELMQRSDHVIAVSEHTKRDLVEVYGLNSNTISVVYPGVRSEDARVRPLDVRKVVSKYKLPSRFLLFVGTMEPRKNIGGVIAAFSAIANRISQDLVIAGEQGWKMRQLVSEVASSPYADRIHVIGFVEEEDKNALYAAADLFVYPSFYEGFGFPPLEAMLSGTPSIVSFNSSLPEVVGEWATLVDPYNTPQIASVLEELLASPARVPATVQQEIREKYSWERAGRETVKILESVV
jgi:glycosyltransferase involved in cell wall biosynthesis